MRGTKHRNPFFRLHEASEVLNKEVMAVWPGDVTAAFFVTFIATVFVPDSATAAQLCPPKNACRGPSMLIFKKIFRHYGTFRAQMAFTTQYPNFLFFVFHHF